MKTVKEIQSYIQARRKTIEHNIRVEHLAGNILKVDCEKTTLAEITALEVYIMSVEKITLSDNFQIKVNVDFLLDFYDVKMKFVQNNFPDRLELLINVSEQSPMGIFAYNKDKHLGGFSLRYGIDPERKTLEKDFIDTIMTMTELTCHALDARLKKVNMGYYTQKREL